MPLQVIAKWIIQTKALSRAASVVGVVAVAFSLAGCMSSGLDLADSSSKVDRSIATGTVPQTTNADTSADAVTVRNAVTSADIATTQGNPIPWANANSGSAGVISSITEETVEGKTCRRFTTTRHSYQGISKFDGNTCMLGSGEWYLTSFSARS